MDSVSPEERRRRVASFLAHQRTGVLSANTGQGMSSLPVWYRPGAGRPDRRDLEVECLVPRWADLAHPLSEAAEVVLIVQASSGAGLRWAQIQGTAHPVEAPNWARLLPRWVATVQPDALYLVVRVAPRRIDLVDEELGWGVRETVEW